MTWAECLAVRDVEAAEQAARDALLGLEAARERLALVTRRERRREQTEAKTRVHLRVVKASG